MITGAAEEIEPQGQAGASTPQLTNAQMFQQNWESKGERVVADLLRTAVEFPESEVARHMQMELTVRKDIGVRSTDVLAAMKKFIEKQVEKTHDPTWRDIGRSLWQHSSGSKTNATISHAVVKFLADFRVS